MRKNLTMTLAVLALSTAIAVSGKPAMAETLLAKRGAWTAYVTRTNTGPACGMSVSNENQSIQIKWFEGTDYATIQLFKRGWKIPAGTNVNIEVGFDGGSFATGPTKGFPSESVPNTSFLEFYIGDADQLKDFMQQFRDANKMWIKFPDGNEAPWVADMAGSRDISNEWASCVHELKRINTQPYGKPPATSSTQPFGKQPESQPFDTKKKPATPAASSTTERGA